MKYNRGKARSFNLDTSEAPRSQHVIQMVLCEYVSVLCIINIMHIMTVRNW